MQNRVQANHYAIEVEGLPVRKEEGAPQELEIKNHFSKFGIVHSVSLVRQIGDLYDIYKQAEEWLHQYEMNEEMIKYKTDLEESVPESTKAKSVEYKKNYTMLLNIAAGKNRQGLKAD